MDINRIEFNNKQKYNPNYLLAKRKNQQQKSPKDILEVKNAQQKTKQTEITDYTKLEQKLGINSAKWGVKSVATSIFDFTMLVFAAYKKRYPDKNPEELQTDFYKLAKDSITKGYKEARKILGELPKDIDQLITFTYEETINQLDNWLEGEKPAKVKTNKDRGEILAKEKELTKQVIERLKQQGIYLNQKNNDTRSLNIKA